MSCTSRTGEPCRCRRFTGTCIRCGREVAVNHGEHAPGIRFDPDKNTLIGYTCTRCR